jgi:predicted Fe-S protein YdhL (DUF1289 family)
VCKGSGCQRTGSEVTHWIRVFKALVQAGVQMKGVSFFVRL